MGFSGNISLLKNQGVGGSYPPVEDRPFDKLKIYPNNETAKIELETTAGFNAYKKLIVRGWARTNDDKKQVFFNLPYDISVWGNEETFTIGDAIFVKENLQGHNVFLLNKRTIEFRNINGQPLNYKLDLSELEIWGQQK